MKYQPLTSEPIVQWLVNELRIERQNATRIAHAFFDRPLSEWRDKNLRDHPPYAESLAICSSLYIALHDITGEWFDFSR